MKYPILSILVLAGSTLAAPSFAADAKLGVDVNVNAGSSTTGGPGAAEAAAQKAGELKEATGGKASDIVDSSKEAAAKTGEAAKKAGKAAKDKTKAAVKSGAETTGKAVNATTGAVGNLLGGGSASANVGVSGNAGGVKGDASAEAGKQ
jgi:hypothetical protein